MNKVTLLASSLVVGVAVVVSYSFIGNDGQTTENQQQVKSAGEQIKQHSANLRSEAKQDKLASTEIAEQGKVVAEEDVYVRHAPPPPISANHSTEVSHGSHQSHGHEEPTNGQKENAPPPPAGANL
jgi:hypothetical protein